MEGILTVFPFGWLNVDRNGEKRRVSQPYVWVTFYNSGIGFGEKMRLGSCLIIESGFFFSICFLSIQTKTKDNRTLVCSLIFILFY